MGYTDDENRDNQPSPIADTAGRIAADQINDRLQDFSKSISDASAKEAGKKAAEEAGKKAAGDTAKEIAGEVAKKAGKEAAKQGATHAAAAAASATGVGAPAGAAIEAASAVKRKMDQYGEEVLGTSVGLKDILIIIGVFFLVAIFLGTATVHGNVGSTSEKYSEDQTNETSVNKNLKGFRFIVEMIKKKFIDTDMEVGEWDPEYPLKESLDKNMEILNDAFDTAYKIAEEEDIPEIIMEHDYDYDLTMESFYSNGDPFESVNYAEFLSIISQKDTYNIENVTYSKYKKLLKPVKTNDNLRYLYCMKVKDDYATVRYYNDSSGAEIRLHEGQAPPTKADGSSYTVNEKEVLYGKVTLRHYDLKSLYEMLELEPNEKNAHWNANNIDMLDYQEKHIRFYGRDYDLGPEERTIWDWGFNEDKSPSQQDYENVDLDELIENEDLDDDLADKLRRLLEFAFSKLGTKYSQEKRNQEGYYDCSSFIAACFRAIGIQFGSYSPTAAEICRYCENAGYKVADGYTSDLRPGDVIFYSSGYNGRYKNVTHVALYVGNGMIIDASFSKGQVVYRPLWGANQIVSVCRPLR